MAAAAAVAPAIGLVGSAFISGKLEETIRPIDNPFGMTGVAGTVAAVVGDTGLVLWFATILAALVSLVLRFRASRGTERQQLQVDLGALHAELLGWSRGPCNPLTPGCGSAPRTLRCRPAADAARTATPGRHGRA